MCVSVILLLNSFYNVYYRLFDICEHVLVSFLLLITIGLIFLPLLAFGVYSDTSRPLFTIAVLVTGVVGGLAVVITVVYFYKFCLKKRPPVATTGKPEWKREVIRSTASSQCRPLPLPPFNGQGPLSVTVKEVATETDLIFREIKPSEMELIHAGLGLAGGNRVAHVYPLQPRNSNGSEHISSIRASGEKVFLAVQPPSRAHSVETIGGGRGEDDEMRRASFDAPRNTGRKLPSVEHIEMAVEMTKERMELEMRERVMRLGDGRVRRMSTFNRSNAINECPPSPVKQISSPLPTHPRSLYERDHEHARSWNPGVYELDDIDGPPEQENERQSGPSNTLGPYYRRDAKVSPSSPSTHLHSGNYAESGRGLGGMRGEKSPYPYQHGSYAVPIIVDEPSPTPSPSMGTSGGNTLGVRVFQRQAKSFDERRGSSSGQANAAYEAYGRRTASDAKDGRMRQYTMRHLEPETDVAAQCQSLWQVRGQWEQFSALGISDPSSASTSFESNTECIHTTGPSSSVPQQQTSPSRVDKSPGDSVETRRNKYKSLLTQRKFLSTVNYPVMASSLDSTASSSSYPGGPSSDANFASSVDSAELERRRLSLMNCNEGTRAMAIPAIATSSRRPVAEISPLHRGQLTRDFSVDARTDQMFREFSRVDPAYGGSCGISSRSPLIRRATVATGDDDDMHSQVVPLIHYPEEQPGINSIR